MPNVRGGYFFGRYMRFKTGVRRDVLFGKNRGYFLRPLKILYKFIRVIIEQIDFRALGKQPQQFFYCGCLPYARFGLCKRLGPVEHIRKSPLRGFSDTQCSDREVWSRLRRFPSPLLSASP